jgi:twinkle protein
MRATVNVAEFLGAFYPDEAEVIHGRAFPPKGAEGFAEKFETCRAALAGDGLAAVEAFNRDRGVYFVVNAGGDSDASITRFTAFFAERDEGTLEAQHEALDALPVPPAIRVETRKSVHAYWPIEGPCSEAEWRDVQARLIAAYRSDSKIKNPSRVMRLPGFDHITAEGERTPVRVVWFADSRTVTVDRMRAAFPAAIRAVASTAPRPAGEYRTWEELSAEARHRILAIQGCRVTGEWAHARGVCHDGQGNTALALNLASGRYSCQKGCSAGEILAALGLPSRPDAPTHAPASKPAPERIAYRPAESGLHEKVAGFLAERRIPRDVLERNRVGAERRYVPALDRDALCVAFPYVVGGEVRGVKYRGPQKTWATADGGADVCYRLDEARAGDALVLTAGELDALSLDTAGVAGVIGTPMLPAADAGPRAYGFLDSAADLLLAAPRVVIAVDANARGEALAREIVRRAGPEKCYRATWPDGCEDANDVLRGYGPEALAGAIDAAQPVPVRGVVYVSEIHDELWTLYEYGAPKGAETGYPALDELYSVPLGKFSVITGIPGTGKTVLWDNIAMNLARRYGWRFGVCSPETRPFSRHIARLAAIYTGEPFFEGYSRRMERDRLREAEEFIAEHFIFLGTDEMLGWEEMLELSGVLVARHGIQGLLTDPWNEFEHKRPANLTETEYTSQALARYRRFCDSAGVHGWIVAHPTKLVPLADGTWPVPTPYQISGSAAWFNKADFCLSLWRDKRDAAGSLQIHVQKVRDKGAGRLGMAELRYHPPTERYYDFVPVVSEVSYGD